MEQGRFSICRRILDGKIISLFSLKFKNCKLTKRSSVTNVSSEMGLFGYQSFEYLDKLLLNTSN